MIHLDTHVAAWLGTADVTRLSQRARPLIESEPCVVSPAVVLELQYLHEIGRLNKTGQSVVDALADEIGLQVSEQSFAQVIREALHITWTQDPFDRIIVANAIADDVQLLTCDRAIRKHCRRAVWE